MLTVAGAIARPALMALIAVLAEAGATTGSANIAALAMLAEAGAITDPAMSSLFSVLAYGRATARSAQVALLVVLAQAGATTGPALVAPLFMWTLLPDAPLDSARRREIRRCCRSCWGCPIYGGSEL